MTDHYCCVPCYRSIGDDHDGECGKPARFKMTDEKWYCAKHYDEYLADRPHLVLR